MRPSFCCLVVCSCIDFTAIHGDNNDNDDDGQSHMQASHKGAFPTPGVDADAEEVITLTQELLTPREIEMDVAAKLFVKRLARQAAGRLNATAAFLGVCCSIGEQFLFVLASHNGECCCFACPSIICLSTRVSI